MNARPDNTPRWIEITGLLLFTALMVLRYTHHVDLHIADEVMYQIQGRSMLAGELNTRTLSYSPLYSATYALLQLTPLHGTAVQDSMYILTTTASTVAVWWALSAFVARPAAVGAAAWWGSSLLVLGYSLRMYIFSSALFFAVIGLAGRRRTIAAMWLLAATTLNRMEVLPWFLGAAVGLVWLATKERDARTRRWGFAFVGMGLVLAVLATSLPEAVQHSWFNFCWHYAGNHASPGAPPPGGVPAASAAVEENFPGAESLLAAIATNPIEFGLHMLRNSVFVPEMAANLVVHPFFHVSGLRIALLIGASILAIAGLIATRGGRSVWRGDAGAAGNTILWTSLLVVPPLLMFFPRTDLLLTIAPLILVIGARLIYAGWCAIAARVGFRPAAPTAIAVCAILAVAAAFGGPFVQSPAATRLARTAITVLQRNEIPEDARLMTVHGRPVLVLAGIDAVGVNTPAAFAQTARAGSTSWDPPADWVLLTTWDYGLPYLESLVAELSSPRWQLVDSADTAWLFARSVPR